MSFVLRGRFGEVSASYEKLNFFTLNLVSSQAKTTQFKNKEKRLKGNGEHV